MFLEKVVSFLIKGSWYSLVIALLVVTGYSSFYITSGTEYAVEKTPNGKLIPIVNGGIHFKVPFFSEVTKYPIVLKTTYVDDDDSNPQTHGTMKRITFADTYGGMVGGTLLYRLDPKHLIGVHTTYHTAENLVESGLKPISKQLLSYTAAQFKGEAFMQGGQNEYQNRVEDQANNGLLVTKRVQVPVMKNISTVGLKNPNPTTREKRQEFVYKTEVQIGKDGKPIRIPLAINAFGIKLSQVTIDDFKPDTKLREFVNRKQTQIANRQDIIEKQENARQGAILAEAKGAQDRVKNRQEMLLEKDAAIITAQKKVELEQKESDLQVVKKKKELEIAKANEGIQRANAIAAKHQATAILYKGKADAEVTRLKYQAIRQPILELETNMKIQVAKYEAMKTAKIEMPQVVMGGGSGGGNSLDSLTNFAILGKIDQMDTSAK